MEHSAQLLLGRSVRNVRSATSNKLWRSVPYFSPEIWDQIYGGDRSQLGEFGLTEIEFECLFEEGVSNSQWDSPYTRILSHLHVGNRVLVLSDSKADDTSSPIDFTGVSGIITSIDDAYQWDVRSADGAEVSLPVDVLTFTLLAPQ